MLSRRLRVLLSFREFHSELEEEMQSHLDLQREQYEREGMSPPDAFLAARKQFGNRALLGERGREVWLLPWLEDVWKDARYALRGFARNPAFAAIAILTLALGVGANTAIFTVLYATCLAPLPFHDPGHLLDVYEMMPGTTKNAGASVPNVRDWRTQSHSFIGWATHRQEFFVNVTGVGEAFETHAWRLSSDLLPLLGVSPSLGRGFVAEEDLAGGPRAALLSHAIWQSRYGGSPDAIGKRLYIDGEAYTIVGVMPPEFMFPALMGWKPELWLSLNLPANALSRDMHPLSVIARLRPGIPIAQAQTEMDGISKRLAAAYPAENRLWSAIRLTPETDLYVRAFRANLWMLTAAAALVLLIACANVSGLLLARGAAREREFAIRRSLGVSRWRLVRQLLTESALLSVAGGIAGIAVAYWALPILRTLLEDRPRIEEIEIHRAVLLFAAALSLLTGVLFGLTPALRSSLSLRTASNRPRLRSALVGAEAALALVLVAGAGLLIESFWRATHVDLGFNPEHVLTMRVNLPKRNYATGRQVEAFREEWLRRVSALPGVLFAGTNSAPPMGDLAAGTGIIVEGGSSQAAPDWVQFGNVSPGYLPAFAIPVLRGRNFDATDRADSTPVAIIGQSIAKRDFPASDPIGKRIRLDRLQDAVWFTVVGIAGDVHQESPEQEAEGTVYALDSQLPEAAQATRSGRFIVLVARTLGDPLILADAARAAAAALDKDQPVGEITTMTRIVERKLSSRRLNTVLLGVFAGVALTLAAIGVFGLISYSVSRRTNEIGIRMALGARRSTILGMIARETMTLAITGTAVGVAGSMAATRLIASQLYGVAPSAPHILISAALFLMATMFAATLLAARRAMRIEPVSALRHD